MGRIRGPCPGYPDLAHPKEVAAAGGISEAHYYKLVSRGEAPDTCGGIPRKIATAWLQQRAAAALQKRKRRKKAVAPATEAPSPTPPAGGSK
jgi:hypothetical protein